MGMGKQGDRFFPPSYLATSVKCGKFMLCFLGLHWYFTDEAKKYKYLKGLATAVQS